jgi:bacterioferritin-associated ferredoxin
VKLTLIFIFVNWTASKETDPAMLVCHCLGVSDRQVRRAIRSGALTADQVAESCGAGRGCGGCVQAVDELLHTELHVARAEASGIGHDATAPR